MTSPNPPYQPPPVPPGPVPPVSPAGKPNRRRWLLSVLAGGTAVMFLCCIGTIVAVTPAGDEESGSDPTSAERDSSRVDMDESPATADEVEDAPEPEPEPAGFGAGVWEVGSEIPPGTYVTTAPEGGALDSCYWARLSGFSGDFDDLITNDNLAAGARGRVTISDSDTGVEFSGRCRWVEDSEAKPVKVGDKIGDGVWAVGDEIAAGTYTTTAPEGDISESCYWARLSGFSGDFDELVTNGIVEAGALGRVEVQASDTGVNFSGGCTWTKG